MIFNQQNRDAPEKLLGALAASLEQNPAAESLFDLAIFCTNITWKEQGYKPGLRNPPPTHTPVVMLARNHGS